ncbi:MAG: tRNA (adenosine(37)-N6)-dimethylallyltransferase MiaA [Gammaproteobacteria bacterium]|nr:tRNA (adenosine(37)-N6)-dimethylallyltransferase MiaA [Gammaproteobacteria bacterium]
MASPVVFLMGPTATGKTQLAAELVQKLPLEIISVDSAMVYRDMDIGTAKPDKALLQIAPHRLINICDPFERYSAGNFVTDARQEIEQIHATGKIPLLVGGTGLYFRSLEKGFSSLPAADPDIRDRLTSELQDQGLDNLYKRLISVDPGSADRINQNDPQRIQRALEIYEVTGTPASEWYAKGRENQIEHPVVKIVIAPNDRSLLHNRIEQRFIKMLDVGLVEEVEALRQRGDLHAGLPSMRMVGYRQVWQYLEAKYPYKQMINKGIIATRQLAKRQYTWLRKEENAHWVDSERVKLSQYLQNYIESRALYNCT